VKVTIRPATTSDFEQLIGSPLPYRVRAFAVEEDGQLLGVGGFAYLPDGAIGAFIHQKPGAGRAHPVSIHKAGLRAMIEARRLGFNRVVAMADPGLDAAERWLKRLGFKETLVDGQKVYVWERANG